MIWQSPDAMTLVEEAAKAGVKYGGYSEDGPGKLAWPYTANDTVYVSKARTNAIVSMSDFLFELNNAIRKPAFDKINAAATAGTITPQEYARQNVEQEVEGMLRMGKIWFEMKKTLGRKGLGAYDKDFFLYSYQQFSKGKKTQADIVNDVLKAKSGAAPTKTTEQFYMDQYKVLHP
jgi:hypothetical protein